MRLFVQKPPAILTTGRCFSATTGDLESRFTQSVADSKKLKDDPGNEAKLKLYSLFKQASVGPNTSPKPGAFDIVGKYKWQAWANLGDKTKEDAMKEYIAYVEQLEKEVGTTK